MDVLRDSRRLSRLLAILSLVVLLAVTGVVFAAWLINGTGTGAATAGSASSLSITSGIPSDSLHPGGSASVAVTVNNPNPFPVTVTDFELDGAVVSDSAACDSGGHEVTFANQSGEWEVSADSSASFQLADAASMGLDSADACQGATFTFPLRAVAVSGSAPAGPPTTTLTDADEDGWTIEDGDCDDENPNINPDAFDDAYNDLNCDGVVDSDGDGIDNFTEGVAIDDGDPETVDLHRDTDGDTVPDYLDLDSDDDGLLDSSEGTADPDSDGLGNWIDVDSDDDQVPDALDAFPYDPSQS
jgi:hypothetical protein